MPDLTKEFRFSLGKAESIRELLWPVLYIKLYSILRGFALKAHQNLIEYIHSSLCTQKQGLHIWTFTNWILHCTEAFKSDDRACCLVYLLDIKLEPTLSALNSINACIALFSKLSHEGFFYSRWYMQWLKI